MNIYKETPSIFSMKYIWKVLLFLMIVYTIPKAEAQIKPLANGLPDTAVLSCTKGSDIYVLTKKSTSTHDTMKVFLWDGNTWNKLFSFYFDKNTFYKRVQSMEMYKDELHIGGSFDTLNGKAGFNNLMKWDGTELKSVGISLPHYQSVNVLIVYKEHLIVAGGPWNAKAGDAFIYSWSGNQIRDIDTTAAGFIRTSWVQKLFNVSGELYGMMNFKEIGKENYFGIGVWNGNFWQPVPDPVELKQSYWQNKNNDDLVAYTYKGIERWKAGNWDLVAPDVDKIIVDKQLLQIISFKNTIWILTAHAGGTTRTITLFKWDGSSWGKVVEDTKNSFAEYYLTKTQESLYLYGEFGQFTGKSVNYILKMSELAKLTGNIFHDANNNCIRGAKEPIESKSFISIAPGALTTVNTDVDGNYVFYADSGTYNIKAIPRKYWEHTCSANGITVNAKIDSVYINNFALKPKTNIQDIRLTLTGSTGWRSRQGFTENYTLCYENVGTTKAAGKIALKLDSAFTNFSSSPSPKSFIYPFAEWEFDSLEIGEKRCITFNARLDSATLNDSVKLFAFFDGGDGWVDSSISDNSDTLKQRVVAAVDPNDKTSFPEGDITKETKELRYQIRFQNTGTDTAYRVTVIDTVDTNLPLTKVMMNSASHKYKLDIKNNVFKWTFDGIMLPDSNVNEPLSHGFINYTAQIKPGLAIGTEIKNTAYIYFDYQKPVITNTARNKMTEPVGIRKEKTQSISSQLHIYPNPASSYIYIKNEGNEAKELQLANILGQVLKTIKVQPFELNKLSVEELKSGIYFIRTNGEITQKLIIE